MKIYQWVLSLIVVSSLPACSSAKPAKKVKKPTASLTQQAVKTTTSFSEEGLVSYYGDSLNGHKTSNGEIFNNKKLTAAHKKLPFGSYVKVTALWNNQSVVVRINDRGPYPKGRIIDISKAAAAKIGLVGKGIGKVRIELVNKP